jgi:hypothetical protein
MWLCLNAVRNVGEKKESGNRQSHRPGADEQQGTCTPRDTARYFALHY